MQNKPRTLIEAIEYFSDPRRCVEYVADLRWPNGVVCPTCGSNEVSFLSSRQIWKCKNQHGQQQFSIKVGTIFEDSPIPLSTWLPSIWLIASAKNGISSYELARSIGVTQKTAWFLLHRIRFAMHEGSLDKIGGEVEADETFIGGKAKFMHKDKRASKITGTGGIGKTAVMGLLERHGPEGHSNVRTEIVPDVRRKTLSAKVREHVVPGSEVFTDASASYTGLAADYIHEVIDHAEAYARGKVHTNGLENFWSLLKRAVRGTYVNVEPFHLFRYLDEEAFRFNSRKVTDLDRVENVLRLAEGRRLTYNTLTGS